LFAIALALVSDLPKGMVNLSVERSEQNSLRNEDVARRTQIAWSGFSGHRASSGKPECRLSPHIDTPAADTS
jgi:hypothetical protein